MTDRGPAARPATVRGTPTVRHAQAGKVLTAGLSTSMVLTIVAAMAHSANVDAARREQATRREQVSAAVAERVAKPAPAVPVATAAPGAPAVPSVAPSVAPSVVNVPVPVPVATTAKPATKSRGSK